MELVKRIYLNVTNGHRAQEVSKEEFMHSAQAMSQMTPLEVDILFHLVDVLHQNGYSSTFLLPSSKFRFKIHLCVEFVFFYAALFVVGKVDVYTVRIILVKGSFYEPTLKITSLHFYVSVCRRIVYNDLYAIAPEQYFKQITNRLAEIHTVSVSLFFLHYQNFKID